MSALVEFKPIQSWDDAGKLLEKIHDKFSDVPVVDIKDDLGRTDAGNILRESVTLRKSLEAVSKELKQPAKNYIAEVDAMLKPSIELCERIKLIVDPHILSWDRKKREELQREADKAAQKERDRLLDESIDAELNGKNTESKVLAVVAAKVEAKVVKNLPKELVADVSIRKVKKWRVIDEAKVPREFLCLDEKKISAACKSDIKVEGIEFFTEEITTMNRGA